MTMSRSRESIPADHGIELIGNVQYLRRGDEGREVIFVGFSALRDGMIYSGTFLSDAASEPPFSVLTLLLQAGNSIAMPTWHDSREDILSLVEGHKMVGFIHGALNRIGCHAV